MTDQPRSESDQRSARPTRPPAPPIALPGKTAVTLLGLRGPVLILARALSGPVGLQGKDLVLRARIGRDGAVVLAYDVLKSPETALLVLLPTI
jgi:hypothetical protein